MFYLRELTSLYFSFLSKTGIHSPFKTANICEKENPERSDVRAFFKRKIKYNIQVAELSINVNRFSVISHLAILIPVWRHHITSQACPCECARASTVHKIDKDPNTKALLVFRATHYCSASSRLQRDGWDAVYLKWKILIQACLMIVQFLGVFHLLRLSIPTPDACWHRQRLLSLLPSDTKEKWHAQKCCKGAEQFSVTEVWGGEKADQGAEKRVAGERRKVVVCNLQPTLEQQSVLEFPLHLKATKWLWR